MRIIAGLAKGRSIKAPDTPGTRPATDRVREAVFSSLGSWVDGAVTADLYAGSGSFGLEALSRGADSVTFVETGKRALQALESNISALGLGPTRVVDRPVESFLVNSQLAGERYDLVFMDPPWEQTTDSMTSQLASLDPILNVSAEVVVSRRHSDPVPVPPENWRLAAEKRYGDTRILRYEKVEK